MGGVGELLTDFLKRYFSENRNIPWGWAFDFFITECGIEASLATDDSLSCSDFRFLFGFWYLNYLALLILRTYYLCVNLLACRFLGSSCLFEYIFGVYDGIKWVCSSTKGIIVIRIVFTKPICVFWRFILHFI